MKYFIKYFLFIVLSNNINNAQLWLVDPLEAIYPDSNNIIDYSNNWKSEIPFGSVADVHVLLKLPVGETFAINVLLNGEELENEILSRLIEVPVEENTGLDSRTEQYKNITNPYVIRRAPFKIFEVINPISRITFKSKQNYSAFRLAVDSKHIIKPGTYKVEIFISSKSLNTQGDYEFTVYPIELPKLAESNYFYTNWFNLTNMEKKHDLERWSKPWFKMLNKYAQLMAYGRQNSITIPGELFLYKDNNFTLEESKLLQFINVFRKYGFQYFESPHLMYRGDDDDWSDPELKVMITKNRYYTENGDKDIDKIMTIIKNFAYKNNLINNWLQHISDEPTSVNAKCYKDVAKQVKRIFPEIKIMEATNDRDNLEGAIDIWCPLINDYQENKSFFDERKRNGEKVLVYTCLIPGGKWLNRTLDMERLRQVYFGWGAAFYNTSGYLHWGLNQYYADPYTQSVVKHPSPIAGPNNYLPAGDTHIIYPGNDGPLSSVRFEAHRVGCEDYELLQILKKKNSKLFDKLVNKLFRSYTDYNLNLREYRETRRELLKALVDN